MAKLEYYRNMIYITLNLMLTIKLTLTLKLSHTRILKIQEFHESYIWNYWNNFVLLKEILSLFCIIFFHKMIIILILKIILILISFIIHKYDLLKNNVDFKKYEDSR